MDTKQLCKVLNISHNIQRGDVKSVSVTQNGTTKEWTLKVNNTYIGKFGTDRQALLHYWEHIA